MPSFFYDQEIPAPLARKIIGLSLTKVGFYDGYYHRFIAKGFSPGMSTYRELEPEALSFGFQKEDVKEIVRIVLSDVSTETVSQFVSSLDLAGDNELPVLSHVEFREVNNGVTEMLYLGEQKFYVLSTSRSTLMPGNIIKAREIPLNINKVWNFDIYEDFSAKKPSVPEGYKKFQAWFQTTEVNDIIVYSSPEFYKIIDEEEDFGGKLKTLPPKVTPNLSLLINTIKKVVAGLGDNALPSDSQFPEYIDLLTLSKEKGICTYALNTLIESVEKRDTKEYSSTENDWHVYMTKEQIEAERKAEARRDKARYDALMKAVRKELEQIHRRRVAIFFDADGVITDEGKMHLENLCAELDTLAEKGFGTKGDAESQIKTALNNSKKRPRHNLAVVLWMFGIIAAMAFAGYSWKTAYSSMAQFNADSAVIQEMIDNEIFNEAKEFVEKSKDAFQPSYLRFITSRKTYERKIAIESAINSFVDARVEQIQTMMKANKGWIDEYTWKLIKGALEYRPEDERLNELRDIYVKQ